MYSLTPWSKQGVILLFLKHNNLLGRRIVWNHKEPDNLGSLLPVVSPPERRLVNSSTTFGIVHL